MILYRKFNVWDTVKLKLSDKYKQNAFYPRTDIPKIFTIIKKDGSSIFYWSWRNDYVYEEDVVPTRKNELFEYWEVIEATRDWVKRELAIYLSEVPGDFGYTYAGVPFRMKEEFIKWESLYHYYYKDIRKLKPQAVSRKDVMEKFWVREDFYLTE